MEIPYLQRRSLYRKWGSVRFQKGTWTTVDVKQNPIIFPMYFSKKNVLIWDDESLITIQLMFLLRTEVKISILGLPSSTQVVENVNKTPSRFDFGRESSAIFFFV